MAVLKFKQEEEEEELGVELLLGTSRKDLSLGLLKIVTAVLIFMGGTVLGISISSSFTRYYHYPSHADYFFPQTMYTSNCDRDGSGLRNFIRPAQLKHNMNDEQLFWRGSMIPKIEAYPFKRVPRIAFMFMTRGPLPLLPLWERFFEGHEKYFSIYVHMPPGYKLNISTSSAFYGREIPSQVVEWGSITLVDAERRLLANALMNFHNERFVLLSESCIPVFSFPKVYNYLINSKHSFVESYDNNSRRVRGRYSYRMYPTIKTRQWRKGSEWFELDRRLAVVMVSEKKYYHIFRKYCKPSCYPDEHYFPTYLNMFHRDLNSNRSITWVDWSRLGPHPATFGKENITVDFIQSIRNNGTICTYNGRPTSVCYLFARKFAPSALEPLLDMSSRVMKY